METTKKKKKKRNHDIFGDFFTVLSQLPVVDLSCPVELSIDLHLVSPIMSVRCIIFNLTFKHD